MEEGKVLSVCVEFGSTELVDRKNSGPEYQNIVPNLNGSGTIENPLSGHCSVDMEKIATDEDSAVDRRPKLRPPFPITLKFEDVSYSVSLQPKTTWWDFKSWGNKISNGAAEKVILHNIVGVVKPGEMLALMGPSGSGKTTLLNILGGRGKGKITGRILYNDMSYDKAIKKKMGFVTQDDVLHANLTVKETLVYAALLRLPREFTKQQKVRRAEDVIMELGLEKCKNTLIGDPFLRGVSGGERKRVSIGNEMLADPSLLLLDEPTSGLDSTIALKIIQTLKDLAKGGRTIISTIHQPSSIIFHMFHKLLLLSDGHPLFYGQRSEAMSYFASVGYLPLYATNPADYLLDLANGIQHDIDPADEDLSFSSDNGLKETRNINPEDILKALMEIYADRNVPQARASIARRVNLTDEQRGASKEKRKWPTTWWEQFSVLLFRGIKDRRHEVLSGVRISQVFAVSIVCGLLWWQSTPNKIADQVGLLFFFTLFWGIYTIFFHIYTFPDERQMVAKESASGMYRLTAYFFARTMIDLPLELVLPTLSFTLTYLMAGLKADMGSFFCTLFTVLLNVLVAQGLGLFLGAALMDDKKANMFATVTVLTFQLASGYFVSTTPGFISWLKYLSFIYYDYKLLLASQYSESQTYSCETGRCRIADYLDGQQVGIHNPGNAVMALMIMLVGYRLLAYMALRNMK